MGFEETAGLTEEIYDSEDATTLLNVSDKMIGDSKLVSQVLVSTP
jgi:hypothetical protein